MSFQLTKRIIKLMCGAGPYSRGENYYLRGKVKFAEPAPAAGRIAPGSYKAAVKGSSTYQVMVHLDANGDVDGECDCPAFYTYEGKCKHIAAVLLALHDLSAGSEAPPVKAYASALESEAPLPGQLVPRRSQPAERASSARSPASVMLMKSVLELFDRKPVKPSGSLPHFESREQLEVQFICRPASYGHRQTAVSVELKAGPKKLYIVQHIRDFLNAVEQRKRYDSSRNFTYDPALHCFKPEDDAVLQLLIRMNRTEKWHRSSPDVFSAYRSRNNADKSLLIPPDFWEAALSLLAAAPSVQFVQGRETYSGIQLAEDALPVAFHFDRESKTDYRMTAEGLESLTALEPYGYVWADGKLWRTGPDETVQLAELMRLLSALPDKSLQIPAGEMEPFMGKAVPGLLKLGKVQIAQAVSERIVQTPLKARLYLDRVRDRLLAGLEFQYGDITVNPLEEPGQRQASDRILIRDGVQERRILELMEQSAFARTESGYFLEDEEEEYEFLVRTIPELEKLLQIFATSAVKTRLYTGPIQPKVKVDVDERTDWLEVKFSMDGIPEADIKRLLKSIQEKRKFHRLPDGALLPLENEAFLDIIRFINETGFLPKELKGGVFRLPAVKSLQLMDREWQGGSVKLGKSLRQMLDHLKNPDSLEFALPDSLLPVLRDYQKLGYQWMRTLAYYRFGGILADDMGLGKTLQAIAFILSMREEIRELKRPALIVAPASLLYNWRNELKRFAPQLNAVIADGTKDERSGILQESEDAEVDVIITSYPLLRRDMEWYARKSFHTLLLDEAQMFKNHATQTAQAVKAVGARYRFALTGTPVENRLEELWSIFDAVFPQLFPGRSAFNELPRETVARRIRPFLLRRLKSEVLKELPDKIETVQSSELLTDQKKLYAAYLASLQQETLKHLNEEGFGKHRIEILAGLTRLRQLCCHPALFVEGYAGSSAKFEQLFELIEECRSAGKRMLVFSQFTGMLSLIGQELGRQGAPYFYLDGQTPAASRVELCNRFNAGERELFLISLKAGGTGLNLTGADTVILYDLWWNPAVEEQAADRAHRIGQKNVVQVIRLIAQGTVEEKMYELQARKRNLIGEVIQPGQEALSTLSEQEIRELLMLG